MAILDQYGRKVSWKAARAAQHDHYRPWEPIERKDIEDLIPSCDRKTLVSHARRVFLNLGPIKKAINDRSMYSVGRAFVPKFIGEDKEFGKSATDFLNDKFYQIGDVRGGMHDLRTNLFTWSTSLDVDGEVFVLLTQPPNGFPQYQSIPSHRIATPQGYEDGDKLKGGEHKDGIIYHKSGAPKLYAFVDKDNELVKWIPAQSIIHLYDPEWQQQGRGLSALTHCINDCRDIIQSTEWERLAMMQFSSVTFIEHNESGAPEDNGAILTETGSTDRGVTTQMLDGGTSRYIRAGSGGKIEAFQYNRPGNPFHEFHERLLKSAYAGLSWPYAFYSGHGTGGGTAQRTEIAMAQKSIEDRQDLLMHGVKRLVGYAVAKAQQRGDLPEAKEWWKWSFSTPPKLTIDDGRVLKELETLWKIGGANMREIVEMRGKTLEEHFEERANEIALREKAARKAEEKHEVEIDRREMSLITPNEQPEQEKE